MQSPTPTPTPHPRSPHRGQHGAGLARDGLDSSLAKLFISLQQRQHLA